VQLVKQVMDKQKKKCY